MLNLHSDSRNQGLRLAIATTMFSRFRYRLPNRFGDKCLTHIMAGVGNLSSSLRS